MTPDSGDFLLAGRRISFTVARSKRRRRTIAFEMDNPEILKITAPMRASLFSIRSVIRRNSGWITRRLAELQRAGASAPRSPQNYGDGDRVTYLGDAYKLNVTQDKNLPQGCRLRPRRMLVNLHAETLAESDLREEVRLEVLLWLKKRAKAKLQKRLDFWAGQLGVGYRKMVVANAARRWGSCSAQNVIRLNWRLIMAPLPILDYVAVHELCHVRHKNHGAGFWRQVASVLPDYQARRKRLRIIGGGLVL
jgi:predicted metal-dependent hydrolase